jgi:predicted nucleic acid-binding protein
VELYSGLTRKYRQGELSGSQYKGTSRQLEDEWQAYVRQELREDILQSARDLIQRHTLRAFDAIHLASSLSLKAELGEDMTFVAADGRLLSAAESEGLTILNIERA